MTNNSFTRIDNRDEVDHATMTENYKKSETTKLFKQDGNRRS